MLRLLFLTALWARVVLAPPDFLAFDSNPLGLCDLATRRIGIIKELDNRYLVSKTNTGLGGSFGDVIFGYTKEGPLSSVFPRETEIALKFALSNEGERMLPEEASVSQKIADLDPKGLFHRCYYDKEKRVLVSAKLTKYSTLKELIENGTVRTLSSEQKEKLYKQLDEALEVLKSAELVHSDLKPDNIMVGPKLQIKIIDYGITAPLGGYPPGSGGKVRNGSTAFSSDSQNSDKPASFRDDQISVQRLKKVIETGVMETGDLVN